MSGGGEESRSFEEPGPGTILAREREARGLSVSDLSGRLKYSTRQIAALEADDYSKLPSGTFVRGMIRAYAKQVGSDPVQVLALFDRRHVATPVSIDFQSRRIPFPDGKKKATRVYLIMSSLALVAGGAVLIDWHFGADIGALVGSGRALERSVTHPHAPAMSGATPLSAGVMAPDGATQVASPGSGAEEVKPVVVEDKRAVSQARIAMEFQRDSWVEITDSKGTVLMSQLNPAGSSKSIDASPPLFLTIGNAHGVKLMFNDAPVDLRPHVKVDVARLTLE